MANGATPHSSWHRFAAQLSSSCFLPAAALMIATSLGGAAAMAQRNSRNATTGACAADDGGITLPPGFCATIFADNLGHPRQMVFGPNGVLYVNTWSGRYYHDAPPPPGGFLIALKDTKGDGHANQIERFGPSVAQGSAGGTGIRIYQSGLYAEQNDKIIRYPLPTDGIAPKQQPYVIVSGLPLTGDHPMHPFTIDSDGHLFVDLGSATKFLPNSKPHCQFAWSSAVH
jgi:glucose/arabinose dehydrogenase